MGLDILEEVNIDDFDFLDFGASKGGMIEEAKVRLGGRRGLGVDIDSRKVHKMRTLGYDCLQADFTDLKLPEKSVRFVTMSHTLEHLPDLVSVETAIANASRIARDFLFIQGPFFDADDYLTTLGVRMFYSNWRGHSCHFRVSDLEDILHKLGLVEYVIYARRPVVDSSDPSIQSLDCAPDQFQFVEGVHPPKPFVVFARPIFQEFAAYVKLRDVPDWEHVCRRMKRDLTFPPALLRGQRGRS